VNGDSGTLLLIDQKEARVVDRIKVGGELEFAAADGKGNVYVNVVSGNSVAFIDIAHRKVIRKIPLKGCDGPSGMAFDAADGLVMSVCDNGVAKFINAETGTEVASIAVAKGADALLYDARRHVAFVPGGDEGQLSIVSVDGPGRIRVIQTLTTQPGTRLGAVDPNTGRVYLPTVKRDPKAPPLKLPGLEPIPAPIPASFEFLVVAPQSGTASSGSRMTSTPSGQ
jgi:DNA-binding beta-propeller fold protein YncE